MLGVRAPEAWVPGGLLAFISLIATDFNFRYYVFLHNRGCDHLPRLPW